MMPLQQIDNLDVRLKGARTVYANDHLFLTLMPGEALALLGKADQAKASR